MDTKKDTKTAKLGRNLFFEFGNGTLDITKSAINFMFQTIKYVAKDGRIFCNHDKLRSLLLFQEKTYLRVIEELKGLGLLSEKDGHLYSHFHVISNGEKSDPTYVRNLAIFNSPEVSTLTKDQKRLFLYIATAGILNGASKQVSVEALYSNKYHSGVNFIESYQELAEILFVLVEKGLIDVFIEDKCYNKNSPDFEQLFHAYCGYNTVTRKKRMSKTKKHNISLRVHLPLMSEENVIPNEASRFEIEELAEENHISKYLMREETIPYFIEVQNKLFDLFGVEGVQIYRQALVRYFETEQSNILYYDLFADEKQTKAVNTMVDFYLVPDLQEIIVTALTKEPTTDMERYFANEDNLVKLVQYYNKKASSDHKVVLEEKLEEHGIDLTILTAAKTVQNRTENVWFALQQDVTAMYNQVQYDESVVSTAYQKRIIRQWAKEGILCRKEILEQVLAALHKKVTFMPQHPIYNLKYKTTITARNIKLEEKEAETLQHQMELGKRLAAKSPGEYVKPLYGF